MKVISWIISAVCVMAMMAICGCVGTMFRPSLDAWGLAFPHTTGLFTLFIAGSTILLILGLGYRRMYGLDPIKRLSEDPFSPIGLAAIVGFTFFPSIFDWENSTVFLRTFSGIAILYLGWISMDSFHRWPIPDYFAKRRA